MDRQSAFCILFFILFIIIQIELFIVISREKMQIRDIQFSKIQEIGDENLKVEEGGESFRQIITENTKTQERALVKLPFHQDQGIGGSEALPLSADTNKSPLMKDGNLHNNQQVHMLEDVKSEAAIKENLNDEEKNNKPQRLILISFAHRCCAKAQQKNAETGLKYGFHIVHKYSMRDVDQSFIDSNQRVFAARRGAGYWIWKPHLIQKTLIAANWGDLVIYTDAGTFWKQSPVPKLVEYANNPGLHVCNRPYICSACSPQNSMDASTPELREACGDMVVQNIRYQDVHAWDVGLVESTWTKRDLFVALDMDRPPFTNTSQMSGHLIVIKKSNSSMSFMQEWIHWATRPEEYITDKKSQQPNHPGFKNNRHDQSILSLLYKKHGYAPNPYSSSEWLVHNRWKG